jgi:hypothetical protein
MDLNCSILFRSTFIFKARKKQCFFSQRVLEEPIGGSFELPHVLLKLKQVFFRHRPEEVLGYIFHFLVCSNVTLEGSLVLMVHSMGQFREMCLLSSGVSLVGNARTEE